MRLGVRDLFGDAAAPDSGFNRIIGEEKIRKGKEGMEKEGKIVGNGRGGRNDSDIGTKVSRYIGGLPNSNTRFCDRGDRSSGKTASTGLGAKFEHRLREVNAI